MIRDGKTKATVRSLSETKYIEDLPLKQYDSYANSGYLYVMKKSYRIMNREHRINLYPEE